VRKTEEGDAKDNFSKRHGVCLMAKTQDENTITARGTRTGTGEKKGEGRRNKCLVCVFVDGNRTSMSVETRGVDRECREGRK